MPTYQYVCTSCEQPLEAVQSFSDAALSECPACGGRLRKVYGSVGVVFKGSGFYKTDSRAQSGGGKADSASGDGASGDKGSDGKKDAAPAAASTPSTSSTGSSANGSSSTNGANGSSSSSSSSSSSKAAPAPAGKSA